MITGPDGFYTVATLLLDRAALELEEHSVGKPQRVGVVPGALAWDECDCGGLLAVTIPRWYYADNFPVSLEPAPGDVPCAAPVTVAELVVVILRCAPQPEGNAEAPTTDALDDASRILLRDAYAIRQLRCYLEQLRDDEQIFDYSVREQLALGPEGACVGTQLTVHVGLEGA